MVSLTNIIHGVVSLVGHLILLTHIIHLIVIMTIGALEIGPVVDIALTILLLVVVHLVLHTTSIHVLATMISPISLAAHG